MRSALGPCSNDDRVSLTVFGRCAAVESHRQRTKGTAGTHVLHVPSWLPRYLVNLLCLLLLLAAPPATHPRPAAPPGCLLLAPAAVIARLHFLAYRLPPGPSAALRVRVRCQSVAIHPLLACSACITLPNSHPPSRHGASFSFPLSVQPKRTPPQRLGLLTRFPPPTCPIALSDSNSKTHSTAASISARFSACRASSIARPCPPPPSSPQRQQSPAAHHELQKEGPFEGTVASSRRPNFRICRI